jgi:nucleotidyltransferase substrate binding protein (TIGR01987 family)
MTLDISALDRAIGRLREGLTRYGLDTTDAQIRDGLIQRFEFTYDIAHKTLRRYLASAAATPAEVDALAFADLVRAGNRQGLLESDWPQWRQFREMRNITSHTYDEAKALAVVSGIPAFLAEAEYLRDQLRRRLA